MIKMLKHKRKTIEDKLLIILGENSDEKKKKRVC